jgi:hypothetical protein
MIPRERSPCLHVLAVDVSRPLAGAVWTKRRRRFALYKDASSQEASGRAINAAEAECRSDHGNNQKHQGRLARI